MNKTKRIIFETAMKLFAERGYDGTSVQDITDLAGVAKGTLYYHFSSKEEIFEFLVTEGMKLLENSIEIKISNLDNSLDKLRAIVLIQIKIFYKYNDLMNIILKEIWGNGSRSKLCQTRMCQYVNKVEGIIAEGIKKGEIINNPPEVIASGLIGYVASVYAYKNVKDEKPEVAELFKLIDKSYLKGLKKEKTK